MTTIGDKWRSVRKFRRIGKRTVLAISLSTAVFAGTFAYFFGTTAYAAVINVLAVGSLADSEILDGPATVTFRTISFAPGEVGVWHYHPGPLFNVVTQGTVTLEDGYCGPDRSFGPGQAFEEGGRIHRPKNGGTEPTFAYQTFVTPQGMPTTINPELCATLRSLIVCGREKTREEKDMKLKRRLRCSLVMSVLLFSLTAVAGHAQPDVIAEWNREAVRLTLLPASNLAPAAQTRPMAIVHVSMHDAVNGITRENRTYLPPSSAPDGASPEAAAIAAAHHALRNLFPTSAATLDAMFLSSLAANGLSAADPGVAYGQWAAANILAARSADNAVSAQFNYTAPRAGQPGVWVLLTAQPALLPGWGNVTPWVLESNSQFLPPPPPSIRGEHYARDYNEIKAIGSVNSATRTTEQTQIATFWLGSPTDIWNQPLRTLVASRNLSLSARARIYALVYLAVADASIICWEAKYLYNFWRPQPAIRRGAEDRNLLTDPDPDWTPLFPTPRHPEYPSGHTMNSSAMATIMSNVFGDSPGMPISSTITGINRQWSTFGDGLEEVIDARVYSGIHFRTADENGSAAGTDIANYVWANALRPCRGGRRGCS